jgi:phenylalanyl-tRNA synthetase beta chain
MKVTYNWLKDFVGIKIPARGLADKLTMAGLEVTCLEECPGDFVFEIEVTSNRPDCLSVIGIAREVAAITGKKLKVGSRLAVRGWRLLNKHRTPNTEHLNLAIKIEDKKDCSLYTGKIIRGVNVGPSPKWLKERLDLIGCRSVNNIVDITNYVLFETGEPLHAFDLDKLSLPAIIIRRAKNNEKIVTIDGEERILNSEILVIADKEKAVALAGVMGGEDTEVTQATKNILLEAAVFNPVIIRRGRQVLGLQSESSYRFERGIDPQIVEKASGQAVKLIQELAAGKCVLAKSSGITKTNSKSINLSISTVKKILGVQITPAKIKQTLTSLDFKVKTRTKDKFTVKIPSHRADVNLEIDLIEEIARIYGYERIPKTLPVVLPQVMIKTTRDWVCFVKSILIAAGLNEAITYSLIDRDSLQAFRQNYSPIEIANPLSREQEILRPTVLPSLVKAVSYNLNQKQDYINIFEIAKVFSGSAESMPREGLVLGIALCGRRSWLLNQGRLKDEVGFLDLKGILEILFERLGVKDYNFDLDSPNEANIYIGKNKLGAMECLEKSILDKFDIKNKNVVVAELSLDALLAGADLKKKFTGLPLYPGVLRDISLILKDEIPAGNILTAIRDKAGPLLQEIKITDYYRGKQIPAGYKGLTISCLYRANERTLTEAEVNPLHSLALEALKEKFGVQIR